MFSSNNEMDFFTQQIQKLCVSKNYTRNFLTQFVILIQFFFSPLDGHTTCGRSIDWGIVVDPVYQLGNPASHPWPLGSSS